MAKCREVERAVKEKTWANQRNEMKMLRLTNPGFLCQKNKKKQNPVVHAGILIYSTQPPNNTPLHQIP